MEQQKYFGDPAVFALCIGKAQAAENAQLLQFVIEDKVFPQQAFLATLEEDIRRLCEHNALVNAVDNKELFLSDKQDAFRQLLGLVLPRVAWKDKGMSPNFKTAHLYLASTYGLEYEGCYMFAVGHQKMLRILCAQVARRVFTRDKKCHWVAIKDFDTYEVVLPKSDVLKIVNSVVAWSRETALECGGSPPL